MNAMKYIFVTLAFLFIPALSQIKTPTMEAKADTARLFRELMETREVKKAIVDSMQALQLHVDSAIAVKNSPKSFHKSVNVDHPDGKRVIWIFHYKVRKKERDTIFTGVTKKNTHWWFPFQKQNHEK